MAKLGRQTIARLTGGCGLGLVLIAGAVALGDALVASEIHLSLHDATVFEQVEGGLGQQVEMRASGGRTGLFAHAPARLGWSLDLRPGRHRFRAGLSFLEEAAERSDGVRFRATVMERGVETVLVERTLDSTQASDWVELDVAFRSRGGEAVLLLETSSGGAGNNDFDWSLWGDPRVREGGGIRRGVALLGLVGLALVVAGAAVAGPGRRRSQLRPTLRTLVVVVAAALALVGTEILLRSQPDLLPGEVFAALPEEGARLFPDRDFSLGYEPELGFRPLPDRCWRYRRVFDLQIGGKASAAFHSPDSTALEFCTDHDGFATAPDAEPRIAIVGDSFVQSRGVAAADRWTQVLEGLSGRQVANFGVSGYAPQQTALTVARYALPRSPRLIVFALFEGNDVQDAEQYQQYRRGGIGWRELEAAHRRAGQGSTVRSRYQEYVVGTLVEHFAARLLERLAPRAATVDRVAGLGFNPVTAHLGDRDLRIAFSGLLLRRAALSSDEWESRPGFAMTVDSVERAWRQAEAAGVEFVVTLLPSKESIYPWLLRDSIDGPMFERYVAALPVDHVPPTWEAYLRHRGSLGTVLSSRLGERGVRVFDLRPAFEAHAARGEELYHPLDSHWNEAGHRLAAEELWRQLEPILSADGPEVRPAWRSFEPARQPRR